jgi:hypothetical protein
MNFATTPASNYAQGFYYGQDAQRSYYGQDTQRSYQKQEQPNKTSDIDPMELLKLLASSGGGQSAPQSSAPQSSGNGLDLALLLQLLSGKVQKQDQNRTLPFADPRTQADLARQFRPSEAR